MPTPVCDERTVVSVDANGRARLYATSIDDGSHDNCSVVSYGIRRMSNSCGISSDATFITNHNNNSYYDFIDFCCVDQSNPVQMVELIVIDAAGNKNVCMTEVHIQQKQLPVFNVPSNITVDCEANTSPTALNSFASYNIGCDVYFLDYNDQTVEAGCGEKTITRTWNIKYRSNGNILMSQSQIIFVRNLTPFDLNSVVFPPNVTLTDACNTSKDFGPDNPLSGGYPQYTAPACSQIAFT